MINEFLDRLSNKKLIISNDIISVDRYQDILSTGVVGSNRISEKKLRIVASSDIYTEINSLPLTYSEYAKLLLMKAMEEEGAKRFRNATNEPLSIQGLFCEPAVYYDYAYVDISDNHYSVYKFFTFSAYKRLAYLSDGKKTYFCELSSIPKPLKRYVYGIMRAIHFTHYKKVGDSFQFSLQRKYHSLHNRDCVNLINDLSQAIAYFAVKQFGAVYANTDGFILPAKNVEAFRNFLAELGFKTKIKAYGIANIKAIGVYAFFDTEQEMKTKNFDRIHISKPYDNLLHKELYEWLIPLYRMKVDILRAKGYL